MFGRDFDHLSLLRSLNLPTKEQPEEEEVDDPEEEEVSYIDNGETELTEDTTHWQSDLEHLRNLQRDDAKANITIEQGKQKTSYDQKVKRIKQTSYFIFLCDVISCILLYMQYSMSMLRNKNKDIIERTTSCKVKGLVIFLAHTCICK